MKTLSLLIITLFCTIGAKAQPWIVPGSGNIYYNGGNVGIGTTSPLTKLQVDGTPSNGLLNVLSVNNDLNGLSAQNNGAAITIGKSGSYYTKIATVYEQNNPGYLQPALAFYTMYNSYLAGSEVERMRISSNGNVGIGTTTPGHKLDVYGTLDSSTYPANCCLVDIAPYAQNVGGGFMFGGKYNSGGSYAGWALIQGAKENATDGDYAGTLRFLTRANGGSAAEQMRITSTGNVGIGTTSPTRLLQIKGVSGQGNQGIEVLSPLGNRLAIISGFGSSNPFDEQGYFEMRNSGTANIALNTAGNSYFNGGNVGIGTTSPEAKLTVRGKIVASEIQVKDIGVIADYVFKPDYQLMSLSKVEDYVKLNQHLPEVPSEKEFKENGMNVAEMNVLLLKKIEELTLYSIEQNKSLIEQAKRIETLEKTINISSTK